MMFLHKIQFVIASSFKKLHIIGLFMMFMALSGCDLFKVSVCSFQDFDDDGTACPAEMGTNDTSRVDMKQRTTDTALGALRKFDERAKIVNSMNQKFVGILHREYAIMLSIAPAVSFSAVEFHLDASDEFKRLAQVNCSKCPLPTNIKPSGDSVYLTNEDAPAFWLLRTVMAGSDESYSIKENGDLMRMPGNLDLRMKRLPFFHPVLDASLIPTKSDGGVSSDSLRLTVGTTPFVSAHTQPGTITAAMIGDIDATDPVMNGIEVVRFDVATVASVYHYDPVKLTHAVDTLLAGKLNDEINNRVQGSGNRLGAASVNDLNKDRFVDFVFSLDADVFVSSYKGKSSGSSLPIFEAWSEKVLSVPAGEQIQSIMAIDITKDGYPELIIVTDRFVHFYLNTPK